MSCAIAGASKRAPASNHQEDPEVSVLVSAAMLGPALRCGHVPAAANSELVLAEPESRPVAIYSERDLHDCFVGPNMLVERWLDLAAEANVLVPHSCLPEILEFGTKNGKARERVRKVIGNRGSWLASLNPDWAYANVGQESDEDTWHHGATADRLPALARLAERDLHAAIGLAKDGFANEPAEFRVSILETIPNWRGEESFLEALLRDRSYAVRESAIRALARFDGGGVEAAAKQIVLPLLRVQRSLLRKSAEIELPPIQEPPKGEPDNWLSRFASIWPKPLHGRGWRESLLVRIVGLVRPGAWNQSTGRDGDELIDLTARHAHGEAWLEGVTMAAELFQDLSWMDRLLRARKVNLQWILHTLPQKDRLEVLTLRAQKGEVLDLSVCLQLTSWPADLSRSLLQTTIKALMRGSAIGFGSVWEVAIRLHPSTHSEALALARNLGVEADWQQPITFLKDIRSNIRRATGQPQSI